MISNYNLEDMAQFYKIDIVVVMKDELIKIKPISGNHIMNPLTKRNDLFWR